MSRGISWRQHYMLHSIAQQTKNIGGMKSESENPVAWREIDYGPSDEEKYFTPSGRWNIEQALRRALRSLERRGLVKLGRYRFVTDETKNEYALYTWRCVNDSTSFASGETRIMIGALLTEAGWAEVTKDRLKAEAERDKTNVETAKTSAES